VNSVVQFNQAALVKLTSGLYHDLCVFWATIVNRSSE